MPRLFAMPNRLTVPSILIACIVVAAIGARADAAGPGSRATADGVPDEIVFPVVGRTSYTDDFGDPRAQGGHPGNDILAPRRALVLAVEPGKIVFWTTSASAVGMAWSRSSLGGETVAIAWSVSTRLGASKARQPDNIS